MRILKIVLIILIIFTVSLTAVWIFNTPLNDGKEESEESASAFISCESNSIESEAESLFETATETSVESLCETATETNVESLPESEVETEIEVETDSFTETSSESETTVESIIESESEVETESFSETSSESTVESVAESSSESETESEVETASEIKHNYIEGVCEICGRYEPTDCLEFSLSGEKCFVSGVKDITLTKIVIPEIYNGKAVVGIESFAFLLAGNLKELYLGESIKYIPLEIQIYNNALCYNEYGNCKYLGTDLNPYYALLFCESNGEEVTIHGDTEIICTSAFSELENLKVINIGEKVKFIDNMAFNGLACIEINYDGSEDMWNLIEKGNVWKNLCEKVTINFI